MATGARPFPGETAGLVLDGILTRDPVSASRVNPDVSPDLERIIQKCLAKNRDLRYQHASDIRTDLQHLQRDTESAAVTKPARSGAMRWTVIVPAGGAVLVAIVAGLYLSTRRPHSRTKTPSYLAMSAIPPATRCSMVCCDKGCRCSSGSRRSSASFRQRIRQQFG